MIEAKCMICKTVYQVSSNNSYYNRLKRRQTTCFVCGDCSFIIRIEAIKLSGINPEEIDILDRYI